MPKIKPFVGFIPIKTEGSSSIPDIVQFYEVSGVRYQGFFRKQLTEKTYFLQPQTPYQFSVRFAGDGINNKNASPTGRGVFTGRNLFLSNLWFSNDFPAATDFNITFSETSSTQILFRIDAFGADDTTRVTRAVTNLILNPPVKFFNEWYIDAGILNNNLNTALMLFGWTEPV